MWSITSLFNWRILTKTNAVLSIRQVILFYYDVCCLRRCNMNMCVYHNTSVHHHKHSMLVYYTYSSSRNMRERGREGGREIFISNLKCSLMFNCTENCMELIFKWITLFCQALYVLVCHEVDYFGLNKLFNKNYLWSICTIHWLVMAAGRMSQTEDPPPDFLDHNRWRHTMRDPG